MLVLLVSAVAGSEASAQPTAVGGVPLGEKSRLHAKLDVSTLFDSNAFRIVEESEEEVTENWRFLLRPGLWLDVPGSEFSFQARTDLTLTQFLDDARGNTGQTQAGGNVELSLLAGSERSPVSFSLGNRLTRTPVFLGSPETIAADEVRFREWQNSGDARIIVRPGGGALEFDFGYQNRLSIFDELPDSQQHSGIFDVSWKFLPKTEILFTSSFGAFINDEEPDEDDPTRGNDATPLNIQLGLIGNLTPRIIAELRAGYGNAFVWTGGDLFTDVAEGNKESPTGAALFTYQASQTARITLGYERTVRPIILFEGAAIDDFQLRGRLGIDRFVGQVFGSYQRRNFGRNDRFAQLGLTGVSLDYYILKYLVVGAQYRFTIQRSDGNEPDPDTPDPDNPFIGDFDRHQVAISLGVTY